MAPALIEASAVALETAALRGPIACVDLETTGGTAAHHRIIEVGIVLLDDGKVVEEWSSLVNPGVRIPPTIAGFTGITNEMVADAPTFEALRLEVRRRLEGRLFVAHNARFDYGFVRNAFRSLGERYSSAVLCTVRLSRALFREQARHNLDTLIERYGLECASRHRALGDAAVLPPLLAAFERSVGAERVAEATSALLNDGRLPAHLPADLADELPDGPGVYLFRGEGGALLYVGKSRSLRSRVFAHFGADHRSTKESKLARQVRAVEWIETGGELGALLLESRLVKQLNPSENRRLRNPAGLRCLRLRESGHGIEPRVEPLDADALGDDVEVFGPFRSDRDALRALEGKASEAGLCLKTLGLERGEGSCFAQQLGRCRGACLGREPRALHDARLRLALASLRIRPWPFPGAVGIRERASGRSGTVLHVIDRWQHIGTADDESAVAALLVESRQAAFDPDCYRILARCIGRAAPRDIVPLHAGRVAR